MRSKAPVSYWEQIGPDPSARQPRDYYLPPARTLKIDGLWDLAFGNRADGSGLRPAGQIAVRGHW